METKYLDPVDRDAAGVVECWEQILQDLYLRAHPEEIADSDDIVVVDDGRGAPSA